MMAKYSSLWRKWRFYKKLLMGFFVLNVFCVVSGFVLSFNYWGFKQSLRDQHQNELKKLAASADLERQVAELENDVVVSTAPALRGDRLSDRATVFKEAAEWQKLEAYLRQSGLYEKFPVDSKMIADPKEALAYLRDIKQNLASERKATFDKLSDMVESYSDTTWELISIGVFTLLFGLIIPGYIIWLITRLLRRTTEELRQSAREIAHEWMAQSEKYHGDAFKNAEFWVQMGLLGTQILSKSVPHPVAQLTGEMAHLIRQELDKSRNQKVA